MQNRTVMQHTPLNALEREVRDLLQVSASDANRELRINVGRHYLRIDEADSVVIERL